MGTITGISDLDPVRWKNSQWRNLQVELLACMCCFNYQFFTINNVEFPCDRSRILEQVGWDESTAGERRNHFLSVPLHTSEQSVQGNPECQVQIVLQQPYILLTLLLFESGHLLFC